MYFSMKLVHKAYPSTCDKQSPFPFRSLCEPTEYFHVHAIRSSLATSKGSWQRATTTPAPKITIQFSWDTNVFLCVLSLLYCLLQKQTKLCSVPQSAPLPQPLSWGNVFVYWRRRENVQVWKCCMYLKGEGGGLCCFPLLEKYKKLFFPCIFYYYYYYYKAKILTGVSQDCSDAPSKKKERKCIPPPVGSFVLLLSHPASKFWL